MTSFAKNNYRADTIRRHGVTVGLPLFNEVSKPISPVTQARFEAAPKAIPTGAETRHLSFAILHHDQLRLSLLCQKVWEMFAEFGPASNFEIAQRLGKESGYISARNNDLRKLGLLESAGKRKCNVTGEIVTIWKAI
jgi:hypothetical protein